VLAPPSERGLRKTCRHFLGESGVSWAIISTPSPYSISQCSMRAAFSLDFQADLEAERVAQPVDGGGGVLIDHSARKARPAGGVGFMLRYSCCDG